ncbi:MULTISPECIES: hypothetical protein [unclassified Clostridium]|uniref:hypothetical protein n=1 Tax=Clostridium TaxID=1485 RepID=UPI001C8C0EC9|nr:MULTISPECIES: hypothetical protein [unclassified Clostridium]MBX9137455.1 hypothetical protein [Clostridium sp. K12(2020)]MBX9144221.1 hypothetical protein [Clostridium sp. K13]MDU2290255.1 hypothetical protein [Clostridium celatum]MDU4326747.1 hypothetical protein [Clostridium celatum]
MEFLSDELKEKLESHKNKIQENIDMGKNMGVNKISAILAMDDESEEIQRQLVSWLLLEGYRISLKKEDYSILTIEW